MVCELHFAEEAIRRNTEVYDEKTGMKNDVPLKICRLQKFAVPTLFPNCPKYISKSPNPVRECLEQRRQRIENEHIQRSIQESKKE
ncbi:hypothetical protein NPIL_177091 [Nephila pilipes]|uniref:THAP-type domain-containing protein n=1 Tax=Nephila pilipes TaxID=299642 RepID=A0A8X6T401_NEPPI|nr:hypothetical protein NPIL_177091 [Nephila pilipes]